MRVIPIASVGVAALERERVPAPAISPDRVLAGASLPAALNYSSGYLDERLRYEQTAFGYNTSGNSFDGIGAGPFTMAVGIEWRQELGHNDDVSCPANDAACQARIQDFTAQFGTPFGGRAAVEEG